MIMKMSLLVGAVCCAFATAVHAVPEEEVWREAPEGVPGAVCVTSGADGKAVFECLGYADLATKRKMTPDTVFIMASNTKSIAAATALSAVADGKLKLDDPVEKFFPAWKNLAATNRPTLRMLLSHTAGLPFFTKTPLPGPGMAALAERAAEEPLLSEPGTKYLYSNWGIDVAMAMVEKATGRPFDVEMSERILKPLGMKDSVFALTPELRARQAIPYHLAEKQDPVPEIPKRRLVEPYLKYGEIPEAGGGLLSTPRDMIRFFRMVADGGKAPDGTVIVSAELMKEWCGPQPPAMRKSASGYSFGMQVACGCSLSHGGSSGTWGEANVRTHKARLFMINLGGKNAGLETFRADWKRKTAL